MAMKSLYQRVRLDPVNHRTFYKHKRLTLSKNMGPGEYEYQDAMTKEFLQNDKVNNLQDMQKAKKKLAKKVAEPLFVPVREPTPPPVEKGPQFMTVSFGLQIDAISNMPLVPNPRVSVEIVGRKNESAFSDSTLATFTTADAEAINSSGTFAWADKPQRILFNNIVSSEQTSLNIKVLIQTSHLAAHTLFTVGRDNLMNLISRNGAHEIAIDTPMKGAPKIKLKLMVYKGSNVPDWKPFLPKLIYQQIPSNAWYKSIITTKNQQLWKSGDGFDIYVDSGRYFPGNCTATKVTARMYNSKAKQLGDIYNGVEAFTDTHSDVFFPQYKYFIQNGEFSGDGTSMIFFKIYTIDSVTGEMRLIGGSAINIFVDQETREQPTNRNGDFYLNEGAHQLSIYHELPEVKSPFTLNDFVPLKRYSSH
jgi:hypothetical protein